MVPSCQTHSLAASQDLFVPFKRTLSRQICIVGIQMTCQRTNRHNSKWLSCEKDSLIRLKC